MTSECFLDSEVASLPHDLQEQVFEVGKPSKRVVVL